MSGAPETRDRRWGSPDRAVGVLAAEMAVRLAALVCRICIGDQLVRVWAARAGGGTPLARPIVHMVRRPRVLPASGAWALPGLLSACLRGVLPNPQADASVLGTADGAALGIVPGDGARPHSATEKE